jgi:hypothetical protein
MLGKSIGHRRVLPTMKRAATEGERRGVCLAGSEKSGFVAFAAYRANLPWQGRGWPRCRSRYSAIIGKYQSDSDRSAAELFRQVERSNGIAPDRSAWPFGKPIQTAVIQNRWFVQSFFHRALLSKTDASRLIGQTFLSLVFVVEDERPPR